MTYETFKTTIIDRLNGDIPDPKRISIRPVTRNNGETLDGLTILEGDANISPTFYLNHYFEQMQGGRTFEEVCRKITATYERNKTAQRIDVSFFTDFGRIRSRIFAKLVNAQQNADLLAHVPHVPFLDLAITFYGCFSAGSDIGNATIQIDDSHLDLWDITVEELLPIAMENTRRANAPKLTDINSVLNGLMSDEAEPLTEPEDVPLIPMYVLTNSDNLFGAACMTYDGLLASYAERFGSGFYILPSSVHELILVPSDENDRADAFSDMVRSVNETQVAPEDVLSDHAYYYDRTDNAVVMCA